MLPRIHGLQPRPAGATGNADAGQLALTTPLGTLAARARWAAGVAVLETPQGTRDFASLDDRPQADAINLVFTEDGFAAGDLFAEQHQGAPSPDHPRKVGGEVPGVVSAESFPGGAERLAGG